MSVTGVFDTVAFDYVFGMQQIPNGYRGICLATDVCSNLIQLWPVYDKSEKTSLSCAWDWIRLHGPPKRILTDQGKEFTNNLLKQLLIRIGIHQSTTSSYNPQANGDAERRNNTVIEMLRKVCERDTTRWPDALGYIELAYNSRINSSTGYSPYEVVHGFRMNQFRNWKELEQEVLHEAIARRALELKRLHEEV
jgi:transposase InsO family protein